MKKYTVCPIHKQRVKVNSSQNDREAARCAQNKNAAFSILAAYCGSGLQRIPKPDLLLAGITKICRFGGNG